jgi:uncharacterized membrane protein
MQAHHRQDRIPTTAVNVGPGERLMSVVGGAGLLAYGLFRRSPRGLAMAATGGMMLYRGLGGQCLIYRALGITRATPADEPVGHLGVKIEREIQVDEEPAKVYAFWRDFRYLPTIMPNLESVEVLSDTRSRWRVKAPAGTIIEWDAEIINDVPNELIAWQTLPGARVAHAGSVRFEPRPGGGTTVRVSLQYDPPGGAVAHAVTRMFGTDPGRRIEEDLMRLKDALTRASEDRDGLQPASAEALGYRADRDDGPSVRDIREGSSTRR